MLPEDLMRVAGGARRSGPPTMRFVVLAAPRFASTTNCMTVVQFVVLGAAAARPRAAPRARAAAARRPAPYVASTDGSATSERPMAGMVPRS